MSKEKKVKVAVQMDKLNKINKGRRNKNSKGNNKTLKLGQ